MEYIRFVNATLLDKNLPTNHKIRLNEFIEILQIEEVNDVFLFRYIERFLTHIVQRNTMPIVCFTSWTKMTTNSYMFPNYCRDCRHLPNVFARRPGCSSEFTIPMVSLSSDLFLLFSKRNSTKYPNERQNTAGSFFSDACIKAVRNG